MVNHKHKKKGVTPLMITLLLISFAVAVGVVIMNLGAAEVEEAAECPVSIGLKLAIISGQEQICYDSAKKDIAFTLENGVNIKVEGLIFSAIGKTKAESFELNEAKLIKVGNYLGHVTYDTAVSGEIQQIKITPKIVLYDTEQICTEQALVVEGIRNC
ncbi:MAG: hypothetical protein V2A62_04140 [Candidatus Woesearchaeota archaeon]